MSLSTVTQLFMVIATIAASSPGAAASQATAAKTSSDADRPDGMHSYGISLIQSGKSALTTLPDLQDDPFGDLTDEFSAETEVASIAIAESGLGDWVLLDDLKYWLKFCLHLATFAVVVMIFERSKAQKVKAKAVASRGVSSPKSSEPKQVDFGPLMLAAKSADETIWRQLLEGISDIAFVRDACGCTALHVAAHAGSTQMAKELIARGADVNAKEAWEETPLHVAAREDAVNVCKLLLEHGADLNPKDASDRTPLLSAGHAGKESTCAFLFDKGGDCGGAADNEIPMLVSAQFLRSVIAPSA